jgi:light-regulated signal transduction histidine kinase (bacteriophytochrome)
LPRYRKSKTRVGASRPTTGDHLRSLEQVDASDTRDKGGSGLGLAICRSIIEQHGGRIWVQRTIGQGSTFSCTLPSLAAAGDQTTDRPHANILKKIAQERGMCRFLT